MERTTPGYAARTAQTLVLAGMLLAPAMAGVAQAAANWGAMNDVIFTTSENVATAEAKNLTIKSGTLTNTNSTGHIFVSGDDDE